LDQTLRPGFVLAVTLGVSRPNSPASWHETGIETEFSDHEATDEEAQAYVQEAVEAFQDTMQTMYGKEAQQ